MRYLSYERQWRLMVQGISLALGINEAYPGSEVQKRIERLLELIAISPRGQINVLWFNHLSFRTNLLVPSGQFNLQTFSLPRKGDAGRSLLLRQIAARLKTRILSTRWTLEQSSIFYYP